MTKKTKTEKEERPQVRCPHCKGRKTFKSIDEHPRGAGIDVPCSRCAGKGKVAA